MAFAHPCCVPRSDATTLAPDGPLGDTFFFGAYTWAAWFCASWCARTAAVTRRCGPAHRAAGRAARAIGPRVIRPGARADVTVFDPAAMPSAARPRAQPPCDGVAHVFVNGVHTLRDGRPTGEHGGMMLRR